MPTKAELQKENETLKELIEPSYEVSNCTFHGSPSDSHCEAIGKIADALKEASKALNNGSTGASFGPVHNHYGDE